MVEKMLVKMLVKSTLGKLKKKEKKVHKFVAINPELVSMQIDFFLSR